jgi:hypothetical protein
MHKHWWDALACLLFIMAGWNVILYGTLRGNNVSRPWPLVVGSIVVNIGCALIGASMILNYLGGA